MGHKWGDRRTVCKALVGKPEGEGPLGRSGHRWKDTITIFVKELGGQVMDWSILCPGDAQEGFCCEGSAGNLFTGGGTGSL